MHQVAQVLELQHHIYPVKVKVAQLCPTLFDLMDYMVHGILQARMLEWGVFPFSRGSSQPRDQTQASLTDSLLAEPQGKPKSTGVTASTSVLPRNTQDWSPLEWTGWISLQSKGLSRVFSKSTVQKHQFFGTQLSLQSNSHIHT